MPVNLVADENVDFRIVKALRNTGFKIISVCKIIEVCLIGKS